jgi:hypothetical protein
VRQLLDDFNKAVAGFDLPTEIPEESFLHATVADASTIERERAAGTIERERATAAVERERAAGSAPRPGGPVPPNLKDIIAADVARAMEVAERAARKAKEMADEAYRASRGHQRHASRMERKMARWQRSQKRCRDNYQSFWGWRACQKRVVDQVQDNLAQSRPPAAGPQRPPGRKGSGGGWVKPVLIALIVLAFIPGPRAFGVRHVHEGIIPLAAFVALFYVAYRAMSGSPSREPVAGGPAVAERPQMPVVPVAAEVRPVQVPRTMPPPVKPRKPMSLTPDTPRYIPVRQRMSELSMSLTFAALSTVLITGGLALATGMFKGDAQIAEFAGTLLCGSWLVLAQSKLWEGRTFDVGMRRVSLVLTGAAIGSLAYWLHRLLVVDIPTTDSIHAAIQRIGTHPLVEPGTNGQPSIAGYLIFFSCLMGFVRWWRQADSFRSSRLAIWSIIPTALVALLLTAVFSFPTVWGTAWAAAISATVQLSAAWVAPRERAAFLEAAHHG